jgi:hypothetical protein
MGGESKVAELTGRKVRTHTTAAPSVPSAPCYSVSKTAC